MARYDDADLDAAADGRQGAGAKNAAPYLRRLPTVDLRTLAVSRARLHMNLIGDRYSDAVWSAVEETLRVGTAETGDEAYNRRVLEREALIRGY